MNFTREPIVETVITPREGYKLILRSSKASGQEEFFVDAVEVITFGSACFYRSLEKPKCFLVPASDYEVLEVREARMVLKTTGAERGIKIGGGREAVLKAPKEEAVVQDVEAITEQRVDKRREKRRLKKRRKSDEVEEFPAEAGEEVKRVEMPSLIPPPATLISETIARYKMHPIAEDIEESSEELPF